MPRDAARSWGCCYVATEALFHLWGRENGFTPMRVKYRLNCKTTGMHWFLEQRATGLQVDITADQFPKRREPDYENAIPCGFMTKKPSKRARQVIDAVLSPAKSAR
jgi:hypothetical protein